MWRNVCKQAVNMTISSVSRFPCTLKIKKTWRAERKFEAVRGTYQFTSYCYTAQKGEKETSTVLHLEHSFVWWWKLDTSESRSEIIWKFRNVVLEKDGEDPLDRSCEKRKSITKSQGGNEYPTHNKKGNLTGLATSCVETAAQSASLQERERKW